MDNNLKEENIIDTNTLLQKQLFEKYQHQPIIKNDIKEDGLNCFTRGPSGVGEFFIKNMKDTMVTFSTNDGYIIFEWCPVGKRWIHTNLYQLYNTMTRILPKLMIQIANQINTLDIYLDENSHNKRLKIAQSYGDPDKCEKIRMLILRGLSQDDFFKKLNKSKMIVPIQGSIIYDFNTHTIRERLDTDYFTKTVKAIYNPNAKSEVLDKFLVISH